MGKEIFTFLGSKILIILTCAPVLVFHLPTPVVMLDLRSVLVAMGKFGTPIFGNLFIVFGCFFNLSSKR